MHYPIAQIAEIVGGQFLGPAHDAAIEHILLDSRQVIFPASSLFIALQGRRFNGHEFIADLYAVGVRNFLVSKKPANPQDFPQANFILVKNTQEAFHALAAWHRRQFQLPVIGITGSNGKTIVKEWLFQLLHEDYHIVRSPKSFNSQTGVPLSVLQITPEHTLAIFEAGISKPGEMERLARIIAPDIGIFTNIGEAHQEGFPDIETKIREKLQLFKDCKTLVYCVDNELVEAAVRQWAVGTGQSAVGSGQSALGSPQWAVGSGQSALGSPEVAGQVPHFVIPEGNLIRNPEVSGQVPQFVTWSALGNPAELKIVAKHQDGSSTQLEASWPSTANRQPSTVKIPFTDAASIENATHCWALLLHLGIPDEAIAARCAKYIRPFCSCKFATCMGRHLPKAASSNRPNWIL